MAGGVWDVIEGGSCTIVKDREPGILSDSFPFETIVWPSDSLANLRRQEQDASVAVDRVGHVQPGGYDIRVGYTIRHEAMLWAGCLRVKAAMLDF